MNIIIDKEELIKEITNAITLHIISGEEYDDVKKSVTDLVDAVGYTPLHDTSTIEKEYDYYIGSQVAVNIRSKPDGRGSVFPHPIMHSFMNGGLQTPEELIVESSVARARIAQILKKNNVGESGVFARRLELNNQDTLRNIKS